MRTAHDPSGITMKKTTIILSLLLAGCFDSDEVVVGTETGGDFACETVEADGRVWARCDDWTAWAEVMQWETDELVAAGDWVPAEPEGDAECWLFSPDAKICTLEVGDVELVGRPQWQLEPLGDYDGECDDMLGPWSSWSWSDSVGCRGIFEPSGLVVRLRGAV